MSMISYADASVAPLDLALAFDPATLFAAGGAYQLWLDPNDISTMYQDTAGTTPITADGQAVARIDDKSGRGFSLLQATAGARPIYRVDGLGVGYLEFSGGDAYMMTAAATQVKLFNSTGALMVNEPTPTTNARIFSMLPAASADWNQASGLSLYAGAAATGVGVIGGASGLLNAASVDKIATNQYVDYTIAAGAEVYRNGILQATDSGYTIDNTNAGRLAIGTTISSNAPVGPYFTGSFYGLMVFDYIISGAEQTKLRAWCADLLGL